MSDDVSTELVVPGIGQVVSFNDASEVALALDAIRDLKWQLDNAVTELTRALVFHSQQAGSKTLHLPGCEVVLSGGPADEFRDIEELYVELVAAGMAEHRAGEVVVETVTRRVSVREADRAGGANPVYRQIIDSHKHPIEKEYRAKVVVKR